MAHQTQGGRSQRSVFLDDDLWLQLRKQALDEGRTAADLVNELLREALAAREEQKGQK